MAKVTPEQFVEKHKRRLQASTEDIIRGVDQVATAPGEKAAAKETKMLKGIQDAVQSGKWAERVRSVSLDDWKTSMKEKGVSRISAGIEAAGPKVQKFAEQFLPHVDKVSAKVASMPDLTIEDSIARAGTAIREMAKFKYRR